jgi:hypothetical protein
MSGPASSVQVDYPIMIIIYNNNNNSIDGLKANNREKKIAARFVGRPAAKCRTPRNSLDEGLSRVQRGRWFLVNESLLLLILLRYFLSLWEADGRAGRGEHPTRGQTTEKTGTMDVTSL